MTHPFASSVSKSAKRPLGVLVFLSALTAGAASAPIHLKPGQTMEIEQTLVSCAPSAPPPSSPKYRCTCRNFWHPEDIYGTITVPGGLSETDLRSRCNASYSANAKQAIVKLTECKLAHDDYSAETEPGVPERLAILPGGH